MLTMVSIIKHLSEYRHVIYGHSPVIQFVTLENDHNMFHFPHHVITNMH